MGIPFGGAPTLLIPGVGIDQDHASQLYTRMLLSFANGRKTLGLLKRYRGDPWKRVEAEMSGIKDSV